MGRISLLRELRDGEGRRMYRAFGVDAEGVGAIYSRNGDKRIDYTLADLEEMARVFAERSVGPDAPDPVFIDREHGASRQVDAPALITHNADGTVSAAHATDHIGRVVAMYVGRFGEDKTPGLYVVPSWTAVGRAMVEAHMLDDGTSAMGSSPHIVIGDVFAREGGPGGEPVRVGGAQFVRWSLTTSPSQTATAAESVALMEKEGAHVDPEENTPDGGEGADAPSVEALAMRMAGIEEKLGKLAEAIEAVNARLDAEPDEPEMAEEGEAMSEDAPAEAAPQVAQLREQVEGAKATIETLLAERAAEKRERADERFAARLRVAVETGRCLKSDADILRGRREAMLTEGIAFDVADRLLSTDIEAVEAKAPSAALGGGSAGAGGKARALPKSMTDVMAEGRAEAEKAGVKLSEVFESWQRAGDPRFAQLHRREA